jgi:hypothetical protein
VARATAPGRPRTSRPQTTTTTATGTKTTNTLIRASMTPRLLNFVPTCHNFYSM